MDSLLAKVNAIEENVFSYKFKSACQMIEGLIELIETLSVNLNNDEQNSMNKVLNYINIAIQNKDYLLMIDLLSYELIPVFSSSDYFRRIN